MEWSWKNRYIITLIVGSIVSGIFIILGYSLQNYYQNSIKRAILAESISLENRLREEIHKYFKSLEHIGRGWAIRENYFKEEWIANMKIDMTDLNGFQSLEWVDRNGIIQWQVSSPFLAPKRVYSNPIISKTKDLQEEAKNTHTITFTPVISLGNNKKGFIAYLPLYKPQKGQMQFDGYILATIELESIINSLLHPTLLKNYGVVIKEGDQIIYNSLPSSSLDQKWQKKSLLNISYGQQWEIMITPLPVFIETMTSSLPIIIVISGIITAWVSAFALYGLRTSLQRREQLEKEIEEREKIETNLQKTLQELAWQKLALDQSAIVAITNAEGVITYVNQRFCEISQYTPEELLGQTHRIVNSGYHPPEFFQSMWSGIKQGKVWQGEVRNKRKDGSFYWVESTIVPFLDHQGNPFQYLAIRFDITERKLFQEKLEEQNQLLAKAKEISESANRAKGEFLAMMSHEIRTPMNGVIGMTGLLLDMNLTPLQKDYVETIRNSGDALLTIINDILDFSKIESGRLELEYAPLDLRNCIESALDLLSAKAHEKGLELAYYYDVSSPIVISSDGTRIRQILVNLLGNAVKFTEKGEVILYVKSRLLNEKQSLYEIEFTVEDTGIGLSEAQIDRLFKPFSQADSSTTRQYGGTGLGLAISQRLCHLMGGEISVKSRLGVGSKFVFTIQAIADKKLTITVPSDRLINLNQKEVLIIDDNMTNCKILKLQTENWGMQSFIFYDGYSVLSYLKDSPKVDLILCDYQMPMIDGLTLFRSIRAIPSYKATPFILLTSIDQVKLDHQLMQNCCSIIHKPLRQSVLYNAIITSLSQCLPLEEKPTAQASSNINTNMGSEYPLRILLAEDNVVNQKVALNILKRMGYRADLASNGLEVISALENHHYDVILMDMQMPEMDGITATHLIRENQKIQPYIIAMTANAMQSDRDSCLSAGMNDFITKPVNIHTLTTALEKAYRINV